MVSQGSESSFKGLRKSMSDVHQKWQHPKEVLQKNPSDVTFHFLNIYDKGINIQKGSCASSSLVHMEAISENVLINTLRFLLH